MTIYREKQVKVLRSSHVHGNSIDIFVFLNSGQEKKIELEALWHVVQNSLLQMVVLECGVLDAEYHHITSRGDAGPVSNTLMGLFRVSLNGSKQL
jgi:hypothetical protein